MAWKMTLEELAQGSGGEILSRHESEFYGVGTDTRADLRARVFIALKGDSFDAHDFLGKAVAAGATALLVHRVPEGSAAEKLKSQVSIVVVPDTLIGLQKLGQFWKRKFQTKTIGLTGTNGKTTTKEFAAAILESKFSVQYSKGSFNNHWGVPISLLSIEREHEVAIIEMGMNSFGEITTLVGLAEPDIVGVTMVGRGHLEGLGSIEGVARAKEEIYLAAAKTATRIFNLDNRWTRKMYLRGVNGDYGSGKNLTFGSMQGLTETERKGLPRPDVSFQLIEMTPDSLRISGEIQNVDGETVVPVFGAHNLNNLMLAASFALACGFKPDDVWNALPLCRSGWGRNQWVKLKSGTRVLFDAYNANPESTRAALTNFRDLKSSGRKIAILAEMLEMGSEAPSVHREMGALAGKMGFDQIYFIGPSKADFMAGAKDSGFSEKTVVLDSYEQFLAFHQAPVLNPVDLVLMKGSRGMQLERILQTWNPLDFGKK